MASPNHRGKLTFLVPGAGLTVGSTPVVAAAAQGATSLVLSAATLTGTINAGDSFTVSGQIYFATASEAASGNAVTVPVYPPVPSAIGASTPFSAYTVTTYAPDLVSNGAPNNQAMLAYAFGASLAGQVGGLQGVGLLGATACLKSGFPAGCQIELWLLDPLATDPTVLTNYTFYQVLLTAQGGVTVPLSSYPGALIRCKTAATPLAGTATVVFSAD